MTATRVAFACAALGLVASFSTAGCVPRAALGDADADAGAGSSADGAMCPVVPGLPCFSGYVTDSKGCLICKSPPTCGVVSCAIYCQYGNALDAEGCSTCACNPPPNGDCTPAACGPAPGAPTRICPDGKTTAGPVCVRDPSGACGWRFTDCPPTCLDNVLCIAGYHFDTTACQCVPDLPPPDGCGCADDQLCVTQIGGPAIAEPIPVVCQSPDPMCVQTSASPCACLPAGDGRCTQTGARACTCDNGIR